MADGGGGGGGGGGKGSGGDSGGGKGGGGKGSDNGSPTTGGTGGYDTGTGTYTPPDTLTSSPAETGGGTSSNGGASSGGSSWSLGDLFSGNDNSGYGSGLNLSESGPVGGDSALPTTAGSSLFSSGDTNAYSGGDTNALGTTASTSGGLGGAAAFAAPEGVSGSPDLASFVNDPSQGNLTGDRSSMAQPVNYDLMPAAQAGAATDYATNGGGAAAVDQTGGGSTTLSPDFSQMNSAQAGAVNDYATGQSGLNSSGQSTPTSLSELVSSPSTLSPGSTGSTGSTSTGNAGNGLSLGGNPLGVATAGAGLANSFLNSSKGVPYSGQLNAAATTNNATAAQQTAAGTALQQYISSGTLPQGYEDQVQQAAQSAKQQIISNYANRGLPTDPTKNSTLAQELAQVDARIPAARETLAAQLASTGTSMVATGLQASGISSGLYQSLAGLQNNQNQQNASAIANFASALNGGTKSVNLKVA